MDRDEHRNSQALERQLLVRAGNDRLHRAAPTSAFVEYVCECGDDRCRATVPLTPQEFESVRSLPGRFAVRPGHALPGLERAVETTPRFEVVERVALGPGVPEDGPRELLEELRARARRLRRRARGARRE